MKDTHLFMFGSGPPFTDQLASRFCDTLVKDNVMVLYVEREGSAAYIPKYVEKLGVKDVNYVPLRPEYAEEVLQSLENCGGLIIGGGDTEKYRHWIVETELNPIINRLYQQGVPIAGFSAGALISPAMCIISDRDNIDQVQKFEQGLGLVHEIVIAAHYLEWQEEENLQIAVRKTNAKTGYGIAERSGLYLLNGRLAEVEGYVKVMGYGASYSKREIN